MAYTGGYSFTVFTLPAGSPGGPNPIAVALNDVGVVVGDGFLDNRGTVTGFSEIRAVTAPLGINNAGQVVGYYVNSAGGHAFVYTNGTFTTLPLPEEVVDDQRATGINDFGTVVGQYNVHSSAGQLIAQVGFIDNHGTITPLSLASGTAFLPTGINDFDQVVGSSTNGVSGVLDPKTGRFSAIDVPGATSTDASAINNLGQIAGTFTDSSGNIHAFVDTHGHMTFLNLPVGLSGTLQAVTSINDFGQVVGQFLDADGVRESFIATPQYLKSLVGELVPGTGPAGAGGFAWLQRPLASSLAAMPHQAST